jgi:hypothetical protein
MNDKSKTRAKPAAKPSHSYGPPPKAWQLEQWQSILKDHKEISWLCWQRALVQATPEVRELLQAWRSFQMDYDTFFPEQEIRHINKWAMEHGPANGDWTHEKVFAVSNRVRAALLGGDLDKARKADK